MNTIASCAAAFPDIRVPDAARYYSEHIAVWKDIFENNPPWKSVRRSGLYNRGNRPLKRLNTAKCLCDEFAALTFSEQCNITIDDAQYQQYVLDVLEHNSFWDSMPDLVASAYAFGGAAVKVYANDRQPVLDYIRTDRFVPTEWMGKRIRGGIFQSTQCSNDKIYTLCERYTANGQVYNKLFRSDSANDLGTECQLSELGIKAQPKTDYGAGVPMFGYFKPSVSSNVEYDIPLGMSIYANAMDTLAALDVAFDSFYREFILGKKRIIVPSAAVQTVTDPDSGQLVRYFDADDEVFTALSAEEGDALKVTDNTMELRVDEHVRAINALLNILCFQTGLSAGALSFDAVQGLKTATEVISQDSKTARTIKWRRIHHRSARQEDPLLCLVRKLLRRAGRDSGDQLRASDLSVHAWHILSDILPGTEGGKRRSVQEISTAAGTGAPGAQIQAGVHDAGDCRRSGGSQAGTAAAETAVGCAAAVLRRQRSAV